MYYIEQRQLPGEIVFELVSESEHGVRKVVEVFEVTEDADPALSESDIYQIADQMNKVLEMLG